MRMALISMMDRPNGGKAAPEFAGKSTALRQVEFALALGCEGIVCLAPGLGPAQIALQHAVEAAGARFSCIANPHGIPGLVRGAEHLLVMAPGLLPLAEPARAELAKGDRILVLPADSGTEAGFERLDLNHAWAGALSMPGNLTSQISALPPDCDAVSALLRIAAQARVPERLMPERLLASGQWSLLDSDGEAEDRELTWVRGRIADHDDPTLSGWLARFAAKIVAPAKVADPRIGKSILAGAPTLMGIAAVCGHFGWIAAAFSVLGLGWFGSRMASLMARLREDVWTSRKQGKRIAEILAATHDIILVYLGFLATSGSVLTRVFAPLMVVGLVRLCATQLPRKIRFIAADRALLAAIMTIAALFSRVPLGMRGVALLLLAALVIGAIRQGSANAPLTKDR